MAIFGSQLVITMIMASILQKLSPYYSLGRYLLCSTGLVRYLHPSLSELRSMAGIPKQKSRGDKKQDDRGFTVPRSIDIQLETDEITAIDVMPLQFYPQYQWLVDFTVCTLMVYLITEFKYWLWPAEDEFNLSMLWCLLVVGLCLKCLVSITCIYFGGESSGERSTVVLCGFTYLLIAMALLIVSEENLEIGLETAYKSFNASAYQLVSDQGLLSSGPASLLTCRLILAVVCALLGAFFTFPGLRLAKMHSDGLKYCDESKFMKLFLNISFISPFILTLLWFKPVTRDYFTDKMWPGMTSPLMDNSMFDSVRFCLVLVVVCIRVLLMPRYLQAYLNMAHDRITQLQKEVGRIQAVELQKIVARVFYYLCVVTLQYITPVILCMILTLMLKTLGGYSWVGIESGECSADGNTLTGSILPDDTLSFSETTKHFALSLSSLKLIFNEAVFRGILGLSVWWCCFTMFTSSALGLLYHGYFATA